MQRTIQYVLLIIIFVVISVMIFQLRTKVSELETTIALTSADSIAGIKSAANTAVLTANSAKDNANTALSTANAISSTANTALTNANNAQSSQSTFASGFVTNRVVPTFQLSNALTSVACVDTAGGYLRFNPNPSGKMSFQLVIKSASGHENDTDGYFDMSTPYSCTMFNDWSFFASSTFDDSDLDEILQCKVSQLSATTFRVRFVGNGKSTNYGRLTLNGNWTQ